MRKAFIVIAMVIMVPTIANGGKRGIEMTLNPQTATIGKSVQFVCKATGKWQDILERAQITIKNSEGDKVVKKKKMQINGLTATYEYTIPAGEIDSLWEFKCKLKDDDHDKSKSVQFEVVSADSDDQGGGNPDDGVPGGDPVAAHQSIQSYDGPSTCISCHQVQAEEMLDSLHMKWSGPTPDLINSNGEELGKGRKGINTFCTYAMSSKAACFSCHVRADGNAPHAPEVKDVDCLMCHSDTYQRKFVQDPDNAETVTDVYGETRTYVFGQVDADGNYTTEPDYSKMPAGTNMRDVARNVHMPTRKSCLRCHATAGGGDWTKRGDMGLSSANPTVDEDVHLSPGGVNLTCVSCHAANNHKISGRGIDLRSTEAAAPTCQACHTTAPHDDSTLNRHAEGQVSCKVCHIKEFGKGGATEMSRDWQVPVWNPKFCSGQGGYVGEEIKDANVKPEYVWFDGTSYVYNIGETIEPDERGIYAMAKANGKPFDGKSQIVPIKRHLTTTALHESGQIIAPSIMWMFMTGDFDLAVEKGMEEQGLTGTYSIVEADAEMLITHGVDPKQNAPSCIECHDSSGKTPDGTGMVPFGKLGYQTWPDEVKNCTLCHKQKDMSWDKMHEKHADKGELNLSCVSCHTTAPVGLVKPQKELCNSCHDGESWEGRKSHEKHVKKRIECSTCHLFT